MQVNFFTTFVLVLGLVVVSFVAQADDFGARFGGDVPSAFEDPSPESLARSMALDASDPFGDAAEALQAIAPAAGDEDEYFSEPVPYVPDVDYSEEGSAEGENL